MLGYNADEEVYPTQEKQIKETFSLTTNNGIFDNNKNKRSFVLCLCSLYIIVLSGRSYIHFKATNVYDHVM